MTVRARLQVNYFPSRHAPAAHAAPHPISQKPISGKRERVVISKENNFKQVRVSAGLVQLPAPCTLMLDVGVMAVRACYSIVHFRSALHGVEAPVTSIGPAAKAGSSAAYPSVQRC